jgi:hypothetical protein
MFKNEKEPKTLEIENTIGHYFQGYLNAEPETLSKAFHQDARLFSTDQENLDRTEMSAWLENLKDRRSKGDIRKASVEILGIDVAGDAAIAKTRLTFPKFAFTDYLSLLLINGQWIIINKIYSTQKSE